MAQFYKACQEKGYTDMTDDRQSLKAKVIATDLKLNYGKIEVFYEKARECYEQIQKEKEEIRRQNVIRQQREEEERTRLQVNGKLLLTLSDWQNESKNATHVHVYIRPDKSIYCTVNDGDKINRIPQIRIKQGGALMLTYHPSQAIYTGATVGGVTTGGVHYTQSGYTANKTHSGKGEIEISVNGRDFVLRTVKMSQYTCTLFRRDRQFQELVRNREIKCYAASAKADFYYDAIKTGRVDQLTMMNALSMASDEQRLSYRDCENIANLIGRIVNGQFPASDEKIYASAKALENAETSAQLNRAVELFKSISDYKDAAACARAVKEKYEEVLQIEKEQAILKKEAQKKRSKKIAVLCAVVACVAAVAVIFACVYSNNKAKMLREKLAVREMIASGYEHIVELKSDGTVVAVGDNNHGQCDVSEWTDIVAISANAYHTIGLRADGTVVAAGPKYDRECAVGGWTDIVAISTDNFHTVGLKADGTVVATGSNDDGKCNVNGWKKIVAISAGESHTVGLKANGSVVAAGANDHGQCDVSGWTDIVAISAGGVHTVGLKSDGTVVAVGDNDWGQCDVHDWTDIVAISTGYYATVGLKADGTVVFAGGDVAKGKGTWSDVMNWTDIVAISADRQLIGLKADGTIVYAGSFDDQSEENTEEPTEAVAAETIVIEETVADDESTGQETE